MRKRGRLIGVVVLVVAAAASIAVALKTDVAAARGRSDVRPLAQGSLPPLFVQGLKSAARSAGASVDGLLEVAPTGDERTAVVAGRAGGRDVISFVRPNDFTSFIDVHGYLDSGGGILAHSTSIQPNAGGDVGHVEVVGLASPRVDRVTAVLTNGDRVVLELVDAQASARFFTYVTDTPATFPVELVASDRSGATIARNDLRDDITKPSIAK